MRLSVVIVLIAITAVAGASASRNQPLPAASEKSAQTSTQGQRQKPVLPPAGRGRGQINILPFPLARDPKTVNRLNFLELYQQYYIRPRAYPDKTLDPSRRVRAYAQLLEMRRKLGIREGRRASQRPRPQPGGGPKGDRAPGEADVGGCAWFSRGPTNINGRVTAIAIDPNNNQRIFVTTVGGIWRSTDAGRRWEHVSADFLSTVFSSVAVNPSDGSEVIAGGGDANYSSVNPANGIGIWRSTTGGASGSWTKVSPAALDNHVIYRLRIDPAAPNNVYAATSNGVYLGTRTGSALTFARLGGFDANTNDLVVDFSATPRRVYAGVRAASASYGKGIWKHDGTTWNKRDSGIATASGRTIALALAQSAPATLYAKVENGTNGRLLGVYKTTTGGETPAGGGNAWSPLAAASALDDSLFSATNGYSWYNSVVEVDPSNANIVWSGGLSIYRSPDGGVSWPNVGGGTDPSYVYGVHADHHAVAFDPVNPKIVYVGNDGGVDRSTDTTLATWSWRDRSHGMILTEFYDMTMQWAPATILAGGSQDNGTEITFGNHTWHNPGGCDGNDVAVDAENSSTLYANCNGGLYELTNPVPGTMGGGATAAWTAPAGVAIVPPLVTDFATAGAALAAGKRDLADPAWDPQRLLKTANGIAWTSASPELGTNQVIAFIAVAPSSTFQTYYVGVAGGGAPTIWRTTVGGGTAAGAWQTATTGVPNLWPTSAAVDYTNASRAFASFGGTGAVAITTDGGANWMPLPGSGVNALPTAAVMGVAIDPNNANVIYAATSIGMFKGVVTTPTGGAPTASWTPFNHGLPDGIDVNGVVANPDTDMLAIGTMGHGMFERDVSPGATCPAVFAHVRDNVFDRGLTPSPSDVPDPEYPIPDPARPGFYKPDDASRLFWWTSADIKVDVPTSNPPANTLSDVDHVEFDSCPSRVGNCPAGLMIDSDPKRGQVGRVYVQVHNRGLQPTVNTRVIALWADATTGLPLLPNNFWTTTFPASGACGPVDSSTGWNAADPASPCRTIPSIHPDVPEIVRFDWTVPPGAAEHTCMLAIVESVEQPLDPSIRATNERQLWVLVPNHRQIGLRNLHVVDSAAPGGTSGGMGGMGVPNPTRSKEPIELLISRAGMHKGGRVIVIMPQGVQGPLRESLRGWRTVPLPNGDAALRLAKEYKLDPRQAYESEAATATLRLPIPPGATWKVGLVYDSGRGPSNTASRFNLVARQGRTVLGGSTYLLRIR